MGQQPDVTLAELQALLSAERGQHKCVSTAWQVLATHDVRPRKSPNTLGEKQPYPKPAKHYPNRRLKQALGFLTYLHFLLIGPLPLGLLQMALWGAAPGYNPEAAGWHLLANDNT